MTHTDPNSIDLFPGSTRIAEVKPITDPRSLSAYFAIDPCIVIGCTLEYGHEGKHDVACAACGGSRTDHHSSDEA